MILPFPSHPTTRRRHSGPLKSGRGINSRTVSLCPRPTTSGRLAAAPWLPPFRNPGRHSETTGFTTPKVISKANDSRTFGSSSAGNMRNRLFYIEFEIKKVDFSVERFGISSACKESPNDKQEKHFAIVNLHHYRMCSFSYC